jgi:Ohr subfamily peroxiredoxin
VSRAVASKATARRRTARWRSICGSRWSWEARAAAPINPEQLFAVGFASCFESALTAVSRRQKVAADDAVIDSKVSLLPNDARGFDLAVELDVTLPSIEDAEVAAEVVRAAHKVCPYSNATRGNIDVTLTANGQPV